MKNSEQPIIKCQGNCDIHKGRIYCVEVRDIRNQKDWGFFSYCENAIEIDRKNGLDVSIVKEKSWPLPEEQLTDNGS